MEESPVSKYPKQILNTASKGLRGIPGSLYLFVFLFIRHYLYRVRGVNVGSHSRPGDT